MQGFKSWRSLQISVLGCWVKGVEILGFRSFGCWDLSAGGFEAVGCSMLGFPLEAWGDIPLQRLSVYPQKQTPSLHGLGPQLGSHTLHG